MALDAPSIAWAKPQTKKGGRWQKRESKGNFTASHLATLKTCFIINQRTQTYTGFPSPSNSSIIRLSVVCGCCCYKRSTVAWRGESVHSRSLPVSLNTARRLQILIDTQINECWKDVQGVYDVYKLLIVLWLMIFHQLDWCVIDLQSI